MQEEGCAFAAMRRGEGLTQLAEQGARQSHPAFALGLVRFRAGVLAHRRVRMSVFDFVQAAAWPRCRPRGFARSGFFPACAGRPGSA